MGLSFSIVEDPTGISCVKSNLNGQLSPPVAPGRGAQVGGQPWGDTGDGTPVPMPTLPAPHHCVSSLTLGPQICLHPVRIFQNPPHRGGARE